MWNEPSPSELEKLPELYATEERSTCEIDIYLHFFIGGSDWYIAEYDRKDRIFYGYAILNGDTQNSEWGFIGYDELREVKLPNGQEVDRDMYWNPRKVSQIERIADARG